MDPMEWHGSLNMRRPKPTGREVLLGLWLRLGFIAAAMIAAGFTIVFDSSSSLSIRTALGLIAAGGALAWVVWQRAIALLKRIDGDVAVPSRRDEISPRPSVRGPSGLTSSP